VGRGAQAGNRTFRRLGRAAASSLIAAILLTPPYFPNTEPDLTNNRTQLVVEVNDKNDY
jgi:hypothetical protein